MRAGVRKGPGGFAGTAAFVFGLPLGVAVLWALTAGPWKNATTERYLHHPVEKVEVVLFCVAASLLGAKLLATIGERRALNAEIVPPWDGKTLPVDAAQKLLVERAGPLRRWLRTYAGRRIHAVLDFVSSRKSANELDDQLRSLADVDAIALDASYSLVRFITWAIPILGFLGTVLGITDAISAVTPETLEKEMHKVTGGLSLAFDATALGLGLTMVLMFLTYLVERREQGVLEQVDAVVESELAHRFARVAVDQGPLLATVENGTRHMIAATEQLVERQIALWAQNLDAVMKVGRDSAAQQNQRLHSALEAAIDGALTRQAQRLVDWEKQMVDRQRALAESLHAAAEQLRATSEAQRRGLDDVGVRVAAQTQALAKLQDGGAELTRLQEILAQNLSALAGAGAFDEAVQSLTAAIHLLTTRVAPTPGPSAPKRVA